MYWYHDTADATSATWPQTFSTLALTLRQSGSYGRAKRELCVVYQEGICKCNGEISQ